LLFTDHCSNHSIIIPAAFSSFPATHSSSSSLDLHPSCSIPVVAPIPSHHPSFIFAAFPSFLLHSHNCSNTHPSFILAAFQLFPATSSLPLHRHPTYCIPIIAPIVIPASFLLLYHHFGRLSHHSLPFIISVAFPSFLQYPSQPHSPAVALPSFPATPSS